MVAIYDESNYHLLLPNDDGIVAAEQGGGYRRYCGFQPRPAGRQLRGARKSSVKVIPRSKWPEIIAEMERTKTRLSDFYTAAGCPVLDQDGFGWCFPGETRIRMADGTNKPIKDIKVLDKVLTAEGNIKTVFQVIVHKHSHPIYNLRVWGHGHLRATGAHPILTQRGYVELKNIQIGDRVAIPRYAPQTSTWIDTSKYVAARVYSQKKSTRRLGLPGKRAVDICVHTIPDILHLTKEFGRLLGFFLAEGHTDSGKVVFTFNASERDTFAAEVVSHFKLLDVDAKLALKKDNTAQVTVYGVQWAKLFEGLCGRLSHGKVLAADLAGGPTPFLEGVLSAWLDGDRTKETAGQTVSHDLALNMFDIANALGLCPVIQRKPARTSIGKNGKEVLHRESWVVGWSDSGQRNHGTELTETHTWRTVRELPTTEAYDDWVFNLEVEDDHSYVAEGIGVHNCHAYSATDALYALRAVSRQSLVDLSPASVAGPVTNWRNQGAWIGDDLASIMEIGCATREYVPDFCTNPAKCKDGWKDNARLHRATDCFDLETRNFDEVMTYLLCRLPLCVGYNWWGHAVTLLDPVHINGRFGVRLLNSWGLQWGENGLGVLMEGKGTPDESYAPLATPLLTSSMKRYADRNIFSVSL